MINAGFCAAALLSALTCAAHVFAGGPQVAAPLLATDALPTTSRWVSYFCWHITTILIAAMTGVFGAVALGAMSADSAMLMTILALSFSVLSAAVAIKAKLSPLGFPSTYMFALIALAATLGFAFP